MARYYKGRAEVSGFSVADATMVGDLPGALEALRWALHVGVDPVPIADAIADGVRTVARVASAGRGNAYQMASSLGMPAWKIERAQRQGRGWTADGLVDAMRAAADCNAAVKGGAEDRGYALERVVFAVAAARQSERSPPPPAGERPMIARSGPAARASPVTRQNSAAVRADARPAVPDAERLALLRLPRGRRGTGHPARARRAGSWWGVLVLPLTVALMVKLNDVVAGAVSRTPVVAPVGAVPRSVSGPVAHRLAEVSGPPTMSFGDSLPAGVRAGRAPGSGPAAHDGFPDPAGRLGTARRLSRQRTTVAR